MRELATISTIQPRTSLRFVRQKRGNISMLLDLCTKKVWRMPSTNDDTRWLGFIKPEVSLGLIVALLLGGAGLYVDSSIQAQKLASSQALQAQKIDDAQNVVNQQLATLSTQLAAINAAIAGLPVEQSTIAVMQEHLHALDDRASHIEDRVRTNENTLGQHDVRLQTLDQLLHVSPVLPSTNRR